MGCGYFGGMGGAGFFTVSGSWGEGARSTCPALGVPHVDWAASTLAGCDNHFL